MGHNFTVQPDFIVAFPGFFQCKPNLSSIFSTSRWKMRNLLLLLLIGVGFFISSDAAKKSSTAASNKEKAEKESDKATQKFNLLVSKLSTNPVVSLSDGNFSKFVIDRPRPYTAFLMFTATAKQYQCSVCLRAKSVFEEAASYYQQQFDFNASFPQERIAFFKIEVDDARSTFNDMQLETVPRVYILPPTEVGSPKMKLTDFEIESKYLLESASATLNEIHSRTGVKVRKCMVW